MILVLLNAFLVAALAVRGTEERTARRTQQQELVALFAADGMTLDPALIPENDTVSGCTLLRNEDLERQAAAFLLGGTPERTAQGGGIYTYSAGQGTAVFRETGSFDAAGLRSDKDAETLCRSFCKKFSYSEPVFTLDEDGNGTASAVRQWERASVVNASVTFLVDSGRVIAVSGSLLPDTATDAGEQDYLTAVAALTAFQQMRYESSSVVSAITEICLCYELQSTAAAPMALVPAWHITTDTASFYVNCASGTVRRGQTGAF